MRLVTKFSLRQDLVDGSHMYQRADCYDQWRGPSVFVVRDRQATRNDRLRHLAAVRSYVCVIPPHPICMQIIRCARLLLRPEDQFRPLIAILA
jgi:hypothetical protein